MKTNIKKITLLISLLITLYFSKDYKYEPIYEISEESEEFAIYSNGRIFIGDKYYLEDLKLLEGDILVEDQRTRRDPNMKIYSSYKINDKNIRNEILEVLLEYEREYPSEWNRTIESMRLEWLIHNLSYKFNIETNRTEDVDLNNIDEEKFNNIILRKILKI